MTTKHFEDITDGEFLNCQQLTMTSEDIIGYAKKLDPQPFHTDENNEKTI